MSAFLCSDEHITALAAYAARHRIGGFYFNDVEKIGAILHDENVKSANHRYPSKADNGGKIPFVVSANTKEMEDA